MFWGFFCAYLVVGAFFNLLLMMLCYHQHRFAAPARNVLLCQVRCLRLNVVASARLTM